MGLSRCTGCHMSAGGHSFDVLGPEDTLKYWDKGTGMANSRANGCHNTQVNLFGLGIKSTAAGYEAVSFFPQADEGALRRGRHEPLVRASRTFSPRRGEKATAASSGASPSASHSPSLSSRHSPARRHTPA